MRLIRRLKTAEGERSAWEGEFLDSVEQRLDTYGRAFGDPEKGERDSAVSARQGAKLKEIGAKLAGEAKPRTPLQRRTPLGPRRRSGPKDGQEP